MNWKTTAAAKEFGVSRETIIRSLRAIGLNTPKHAVFSTRQIHLALAGDVKTERAKELREKTKLLTMQRERQEGSHLNMAEVEKLLSELVILPLRQALMSLPTTCDARCNPTDPTLAREALTAWRNDTLRLLRDKLQPETK